MLTIVYSLWTWPWTRRTVLPVRKPQRRHSQSSTATKYKTCGMLAIFLCVGLIFWVQMSYYSPTRGDIHSIDMEMRSSTRTKKKNPSLAVLVAGSTQRFLFDSFVEHVAGAAHQKINKAVDIDYFAILTLKSGPAFRQDAGYMGHLAGRDDIFKAILGNSSNKAPVDVIQNQMINAMTSALSSNTKNSKTNIRALRLLEEPIEDDPILDGVRKKEEKLVSQNSNGNEEPFDLFRQFPMMDKRQKALTRTQAGNKNMIRLFLALESLWNTEFLGFERNREGGNYDFVLILRDDTLWLDDFDLHKVIATDPTADAYILSCDGRQPKMLPPELNDHGILISRKKASVVGKYVSAMASLDLHKCHESVEEWLGKQRGCNSEMILKHVLESNQIKVKLVPQSVLPFERAVLIDGESKGDDYYCYHKFCQSIDQPLELPSEIKKCKDLTFPAQ